MAWTFHPKFVFRSSFGITHSDLYTNSLNQNFEEYQATASIQAPVGDPNPVFRLSDGPPAYTFNVAPDGSVPFVGTNYSGRNASWYDPNMRLPYIATWSGGIQYQLSNSIVVEGRYQGSAGVGLLNNWNINVIPLDVAANDPARQQQIFQNYQNFRPFPQFNTINHYSNYGHNTYHGGTWRVEKRYSAGITFNVFYTYSKTINDADDDGTASGITYYNRRLEKARASYDIQHRAVGVFTWDLPFGKGRRWMSGGGWKDWFFGGWDGAWTQTYQSGPPVSVTFAGSPNNYFPNGVLRPNQIAPDAVAQPSGWDIGPNRFPISAQNRYFSFDGFAYPAAFTAGTLGRNTFEGPGLRWTQVSLSKEFRITERARFEIRWDVNNLTKEPQFADPNAVFNTDQPCEFWYLQRDSRELLGHRDGAYASFIGWAVCVLAAWRIIGHGWTRINTDADLRQMRRVICR